VQQAGDRLAVVERHFHALDRIIRDLASPVHHLVELGAEADLDRMVVVGSAQDRASTAGCRAASEAFSWSHPSFHNPAWRNLAQSGSASAMHGSIGNPYQLSRFARHPR
jgi:hypothetical protein